MITATAGVLTGRDRQMRNAVALTACLLACVLAYHVLLGPASAGYHWTIRTTSQGLVTWVDPANPAFDQGVRAGDHLVGVISAMDARLPLNDLAGATTLLFRHANGRPIPTVHPPTSDSGARLALALLALLFMVCGCIVWLRARTRGPAAYMFALCLTIALTLLSAIGAQQGDELSARVVGLGSAIFALLFASFFLRFPRNRLSHRFAWWNAGALTGCCLLLTALYLASVYPSPDLYPAARILFELIFLGGILTAIVAIATGYGGVEEQARRQRRILLAGMLAALVPFMALSVIPQVITGAPMAPFGLSILPLGFLPLAFGYAILKYDLLQMDSLVRRAAVHSLFVGGLLVVYLGVIYLTSILLSHRLGSEPATTGLTSFIALLAATLVVGLVMAPLRSAVQTGVERLLFPEVYRYHRLVREGDLPTEGTDLGVLADLLDTNMRGLLPVRGARLFVRQEDDCYTHCIPLSTPIGGQVGVIEGVSALLCGCAWLNDALAHATWGSDVAQIAAAPGADPRLMAELAALDVALIMPLRQNGAMMGFLAVRPRADGTALTGVDRELIALVADRYALAVDHALLLSEREQQVRDISSLYQASVGLTKALGVDEQTLPEQIVTQAVNIAGTSRAVLTLITALGPRAVVRSAEGAESGPTPLPEEVGVEAEELGSDAREARFDEGERPVAHLPLQAGDQLLGVLRLERRGTHRFSAEERRLLTMFANQAGVALEHAQLYDQAVHHAEREPLTGLYNHRMITGFLEREVSRAKHDRQAMSVLLMDIDGFKLFNDTYGHLAGDQLLRRVAQVLEICSRQTDLPSRTGGDEFVVVLPGADHVQGRTIAERIHATAAARPYEAADGGLIPLHLSVGVASYPHDGDSAHTLLTVADERMYAAKRSGTGVRGPARTTDEHTQQNVRGFGTLEALVAAVDNKDSYTAKHSDQVAQFAILLARQVGASQETLRILRVAGLLHDVGKIGVPDRVLRKPGRLTDEEVEIMQLHVQLSEMLVRTIMPDAGVLDAMRYHHERWDGRGYPYGAAGEGIPLLGRIMIVADAVSAMVMDRPYRKGLSLETVYSELRRAAGTQFDPDLVEPFIAAIEEVSLDVA